MKRSTILKLSDYKNSSWAVWSKKFNHKDSIESDPNLLFNFILSKRKDLLTDVIFLGLNKSGNGHKASEKFGNFHKPSHPGDGLLNKLIEGCSDLSGGYMTDLSLEIESDSNKVRQISESDFERLADQFDILGANKFFIITFGRRVFKELIKASRNITQLEVQLPDVDSFVATFEDNDITVFYVVHYSYAVRYNKTDRIKKQLSEINRLVKRQRAS